METSVIETKIEHPEDHNTANFDSEHIVINTDAFESVAEHTGSMQEMLENHGSEAVKQCPYLQNIGEAGLKLFTETVAREVEKEYDGPSFADFLNGAGHNSSPQDEVVTNKPSSLPEKSRSENIKPEDFIIDRLADETAVRAAADQFQLSLQSKAEAEEPFSEIVQQPASITPEVLIKPALKIAEKPNELPADVVSVKDNEPLLTEPLPTPSKTIEASTFDTAIDDQTVDQSLAVAPKAETLTYVSEPGLATETTTIEAVTATINEEPVAPALAPSFIENQPAENDIPKATNEPENTSASVPELIFEPIIASENETNVDHTELSLDEAEIFDLFDRSTNQDLAIESPVDIVRTETYVAIDAPEMPDFKADVTAFIQTLAPEKIEAAESALNALIEAVVSMEIPDEIDNKLLTNAVGEDGIEPVKDITPEQLQQRCVELVEALGLEPSDEIIQKLIAEIQSSQPKTVVESPATLSIETRNALGTYEYKTSSLFSFLTNLAQSMKSLLQVGLGRCAVAATAG